MTTNAPLFWTRFWAAVRFWAGLDWPSWVTSWSLCPFTPPLAFTASMRAWAPPGPSRKVDDATPVWSVMYPITIGALAAEAACVPMTVSDAEATMHPSPNAAPRRPNFFI